MRQRYSTYVALMVGIAVVILALVFALVQTA